MNHRIAAISLAAALSACQAAAPEPRQSVVLQEDLSRLKADRDAGRISYTQWAERTGAAARASVVLTSEQEQAIAFRTQLARRVDAGELTPAQFDQESARTLQRLKAAQGDARTRS
ncbi:hypothetical protein MKK63_08700 [Methylobacterium sp. J-088]|uniref:hypothetical protein n=1 Tax=Methylobacterium sp. J-088 TaxID=2836664 RepID=UPI001FBA3964|nr:hypothetical protein [Methylobacterium sp. J-088]MCJ2062786.1 hypothetical protein [Methylobacterium sp. J-088]